MCQLSLISAGEQLNRLLLTVMLQTNTPGNRDGTGFLAVRDQELEVWKTEKSADTVSDLGLIIRKKIQGDSPVMAHVRSASPGMPVTEDNAHPFMGERFVLAHNGRLHPGKAKVSRTTVETTEIESDSCAFLKALEIYCKKHPDASFIEAFNSVMDNFMGKFAFLIYDMQTNTHYVARGSTADLHVTSIFLPGTGKSKDPKLIGFAVNTAKISLVDALWSVSQIIQVNTGRDIFFNDPIEIEKNTLWEVKDGSLHKLGEIKENPVVYETYYNPATVSRGAVVPAAASGTHKTLESIYRYMVDHFFSEEDIDLLLEITTMKKMSETTEKDLESFVKLWIPRLSASKQLRKDIQSIIGEFGKVSSYIYAKVPDLEYPWTINTKDKIKEMIKTMKEIYKKQ